MGGISVLVLLGIMSAIFYLFIAVFIIIVIYLVVVYIFESIFMMKVLKNSNKKGRLLAWLPFYNKYLLGKIADRRAQGIAILIINLIVVGVGVFFYLKPTFYAELFGIFLLLILINFILNIVVSHNIFKKALSKYGDILTIFSVLTLGLLRPIFLFVLRNKQELYLKGEANEETESV